MRASVLTSIAGLVFAAIPALAADAPPTAASLLDAAQSKAAGEHKAVFLIFHASWCGWCHRLDQFIETPEIQPIIGKYFVPVHVVVQEHGEKASLDNPGGAELMAQVGNKETGLPLFAFLDAGGKPIVNSIRPAEGKSKGGNIGYPSEPQEIDWFLVMLGKAAPQMTSSESAVLEQWLRQHSH